MAVQDSAEGSSPAPPPLPYQPAVPPQASFQMTPYGSVPMVTEEDKTLGTLCHLLGIFTGFLGPLILWLVKKDSSPYIAHHGREALNFQLTLLLCFMGLGAVTVVLMFVFVGVLLIPVLIVLRVLALVAEIMAAVAAQKGEWHRYPFCFRLV